MEAVEIKKNLYKNKQNAVLVNVTKSGILYKCDYSDSEIIFFKVPLEDIEDGKFATDMPAHLLLRWLKIELYIKHEPSK